MDSALQHALLRRLDECMRALNDLRKQNAKLKDDLRRAEQKARELGQ